MYKHTKELSPVTTAIPGSPVANIMQNKIIGIIAQYNSANIPKIIIKTIAVHI